ncbi:uncharacterized protein LOC110059411 [Orbicella faveolata]|uniref:uncharacterized protein LOC110059411 n=1 Tax=Orbicella faveolata TaxID=48498 RepID=UPI0009E21743|nr:uncharacterized protein LOC110059411 [Orbicella faveolata]
MSKLPVLVNGQTFKYILTVQDVFSRFLWLHALSSKVSKEVASTLADLYMEVGPPKVLQADNGVEFKKAVWKRCEKLAVKIVRGSPYHPQSQDDDGNVLRQKNLSEWAFREGKRMMLAGVR